MRPDGSIHVEHLWKRFRADRAARGLRDRVRMPQSSRDADAWRWVLRDIDLELQPGESVGLIGSNGSGKSTLLKILTGVMYPYAGRYEVHGRVGALLEVRAGLHADLSGRENIYLYGSLLGLSRAEITRRFDDIVDFADIPDAIDRQIKFYSSGMQMRLGFSVAAFLEPDILLVDEALAVGDAFFQQRCLDRMRELLHQGTTLVLVSHDLAAIESVCRRGVWLSDGVVMSDDETRTTLGRYREFVEHRYHDWIDATAHEAVRRASDLSVERCTVTATDGGTPRGQEPVVIDLELTAPSPTTGRLTLGITEGTATPLFIVSEHVELDAGTTTIRCRLPFLPLAAGRFYLWLEVEAGDGSTLLPWQPGTQFAVDGAALTQPPIGVMRVAAIQVDAEWEQAPSSPAPTAEA